MKKKKNINEKKERQKKLLLRAYRYYLQALEDLKKAKPDRLRNTYRDEKYLRKASGMLYLVFKILLKIVSIEYYNKSNKFKYRSDIENFIEKINKKYPELFEKDLKTLYMQIIDFYLQFHVYGYYEGEVNLNYFEQSIKLLEEYIYLVSEKIVGITRKQLKEKVYYLNNKKMAIKLTYTNETD